MKNRRPTKDDGCCSVHFLKYVLFIFNFLFYFAGLAVIGVGVWTVFWKSSYVPLLPSNMYSLTTYILIGAGVLVLLVGIFGCVGVLTENRCCLLLFTFLLLVIFFVEATAGVLSYIYSEKLNLELKKHLNTTLTEKYSIDQDVTKAAAKLHTGQHECCGADGYRDWRHSAWYKTENSDENLRNHSRQKLWYAPESCCVTPAPNCADYNHPSNIYMEGCIPALTSEIKKHEILVGAVALGISTVQIFGMIISCCLYVKLKDFEDVERRRDKSNYY